MLKTTSSRGAGRVCASVRASSSRWALLAAGALLSSVSGCDCAGTVTVPTDANLAFFWPLHGQVLTSQDDVNAGADGIQINIEVTAIGLDDGTQVVLTNSRDLDGTGAPTPTNGTVSNGRVVFAGYTVQDGEVTLRVVRQGITTPADCAVSKDCDEITVTAVQSLCEFNTPRSGDVLTTDSYPNHTDPFDPFETDILLDCRGTTMGEYVALVVDDGLPHVAQVDATGRVTFSRIQLSEGANVLTARPKTNASGFDSQGASTTATVTVSTGRCIAALSPRDGSRVLADDDLDLNPDNGMQANIDLLTDCAETSTVSLYLKAPGATSFQQLTVGAPQVMQDAAGLRFRLGNVALPESVSPFDIVLVGRVEEPSGGRFGSTIQAAYWVDSTRPRLVSYAPGAGACVGPAQDADDDPSNGIQLNAFGSLTGAEDGSEVWVRASAVHHPTPECSSDAQCTNGTLCRGGLCRLVTTVIDGAFTANGVPTPNGEVTLEYVGLDLAGNQSQPVTAAINVIGALPSVAIVQPSEGALLGAAADLDPVLPDLQYAVQLSVANVTEGATGTLTISGQAPVPFVPQVGAAGQSSVTVALVDGQRTLRARIEDTCGNSVDSPTVTVNVASQPPDLLVTAYEHDDNGFAERRSLTDGAYTRAASLDLDVTTGVGVAARTVTISRSPAFDMGSGNRACAGGATQLASVQVAAADVGTLAQDLALVDGANCFDVSVDDGVNPTSMTLVVNSRTSAPAITIDAPLDGATLSTDSDGVAANGFNEDVAVSLAAPNDLPGVVELHLSSSALGGVFNRVVAPLAAGGDTLVLTGASLPAGSFDIIAIYRDVLGNESADTISVTVSAGAGPEVAIIAPQSGSVMQSSAGTIDVTLAHLGAATASSCDVLVDGVSALVAAWATPASPLTVQVPIGEGERVIQARCDDGADTGTTQSISLVIDDTAPGAPQLANEAADAPGRLVFDQTPAYVNLKTPDDSSVAGLQHTLRVLVPTGGEDPVGWTVALTVTPPGGSAITYSRVLTGGGDPVLVVFDAADFGASDGDITFAATVTDAAGNTSSAASATLTIDRTPPALTQLVPSPSKTELTRSDDANANAEYVDVAFTYTVTGAAPGSNLSLNVSPVPANRVAGDFPLTVPVATGNHVFPMLAFEDDSYLATVTAVDAAGNSATLAYAFDVRGIAAQITFAIPSAAGTLNRSRDTRPTQDGMQMTFAFNAAGLLPGTAVNVCSSLPRAGATTPCRWGRTAGVPTLGGADAGFVIGTGYLSGSIASSSVFISDVALEEGAQVIHAEARETDGDPDVSSQIFDFIVDSIAPKIATASLGSNSTDNDGGTMRLRAPTEGSIVSGKLRTPITVTATGLEDGRTVRVYSTRPATNTQVGSGAVASGAVTFNVDLSEGAQTLTFATTDAAGNANVPAEDGIASIAVTVDFTPGTVAMPGALVSPYTSLHGQVQGGELQLGGAYGIVVGFADNQSPTGGTVKLERYAAASGGTATHSAQQTIGAGQSSVTFAGYPLAPGLNYLQAIFTDPAGNAVTSARALYAADFMGPTLTLAVADGTGAAVGACGSFATACVADIEQPNPSDNRAQLDTDASSAYCPAGAYPCNALGTMLLFSLTSCVNSDASLESCPITARLESRVVDATNQGGPGDPRPFATVFASTLSTGEVAAPASLDAALLAANGADLAFDPGVMREVRLVATDSNGNRSVSSSVFLQLGIDGVLIAVQRLDASMNPTGEYVEDGDYFGMAENVSATVGVFAGNFRVEVVQVGADVPTDVELTLSNGDGVQTLSGALSGGAVDFADVTMKRTIDPASPNYNVLTAEVSCGASVCGQRIYDELIADIDAPTYQFERCSLCALGVPLVDDALCSTCGATDGDADANIAGAPTPAIWNAAGDQDGNPSNGFTITTTPLVVKLNGVENGQLVTLSSDQGALAGSSVLSSGCPTPATCKATFNGLGVPSLSGTLIQKISVSFRDRAGNFALPDPVRGTSEDESIYSRTDVLAPAGVKPTACIGESTTPVSVADPASDPTTYEEPSCAALCTATGSCSRRGGEASLSWVAPGDDGSSGNMVSGYTIGVAALGIPYPGPGGTTYTACDQLTAEGPFEQTLSYAPVAGPGGAEQLPVADLYPHRSYCFAVIAQDDVGNEAPVGTFARERKVPLLNHPDTVTFVPQGRDDDAAGVLYAQGTPAGTFGYVAAGLGDMDGDGREDFAVSELSPSKVSMFLTTKSLLHPDVVISAPAISDGAFGFAVAGGDFDGDGLSDMAICARDLTTVGAADSGSNGGALFLYYGVAGSGIRRDTNTTDAQLPSINPDVAILGPQGHQICRSVVIANVDASTAADLIMATSTVGARPRVYGFRGGSRERFPGSPPSPTKIYLRVADSSDHDVAGGTSNEADFVLKRKSVGYSSFPNAIAVADVNGDGVGDVVVSDQLAAHDGVGTCTNCGEVYVYDGNDLDGVIEGADAAPAPAALMHVLRYVPGSGNFGQSMMRVPQPRGSADAADWLLVQVAAGSRGRRVVVFKGTALGGTPGIMPAAYPIGGADPATYSELDRTRWNGTTESLYGVTMAGLGEFDGAPGVDILVGPGNTTTAGVYGSYLYSYDMGTDSFQKRAILWGGAGFATRAVGLSGFTGSVGAWSTQLLLTARPDARLFLFE